MILSSDFAISALAVASVIALLGYLTAALFSQGADGWRRMALIGAWIAHAVAITVDVIGVGSALPGVRFGFAPTLSVTVWLVLAMHFVESRFVPLHGAQRAPALLGAVSVALLGAVSVALAWAFPGELHPNTDLRWAPLHWVLGVASYGLFGAAVLHCALLTGAERRMRLRSALSASVSEPRQATVPLLRLEKLTFRFVMAGFAALSVTLVLGWLFSAPWRWDHKSVFSLLSWAVFAGLLAGRYRFGWRGRRARRWLYAGAILLLLAYVGSRFVLEVLLQRVSAL